LATDTAIKALIAKGFSVRKAAEFMGISPTTVMRVRKEMTAQAQPGPIQPFGSAARDEKLGRLVDHFLDKGLKLRKIKGSDAIAAGKLYADRRYPTRSDPAPPAVSYTQVNLVEILDPDPTKYSVPPTSQVIDLEPNPGPDATTIQDIKTPGHESGPDEDPA
jgi:hypothetical protein